MVTLDVPPMPPRVEYERLHADFSPRLRPARRRSNLLEAVPEIERDSVNLFTFAEPASADPVLSSRTREPLKAA
jgi:hypothetical protein